jgi:hypothetical protein
LSNDTNNNLKFRVLIIDLLESRRAKAEEVAKRLLVANRPQEPRDNPNEAVLMDVEVQTFSPENVRIFLLALSSMTLLQQWSF